MNYKLSLPLLFAALIVSSCHSDDSEAGTEEANHEQESFQALEMISKGEDLAEDAQDKIEERAEDARELLGILEKQPTAKPVPSRPGYVFNPWTNQIVDVQGLPPGTLVRDPADPVPNRKFRTPKP